MVCRDVLVGAVLGCVCTFSSSVRHRFRSRSHAAQHIIPHFYAAACPTWWLCSLALYCLVMVATRAALVQMVESGDSAGQSKRGSNYIASIH